MKLTRALTSENVCRHTYTHTSILLFHTHTHTSIFLLHAHTRLLRMYARQSAPLPSLWVTCESPETPVRSICEESIQCIRNRARVVTL